MRLAVGILHYRYWPGVRDTIDGLLAQTRPADTVVLVDHASGDGSADQIRAAYPDLEVVEFRDNRGPTAGINRVLQTLLERDPDAVCAIPHDFDMAPDALEHLARRLEEEPALGAAGPLVAHQRDRELVFYAGGRVRRKDWSLDFIETPTRLSEWDGRPPHEVDFLEVGGVVFRADAVRQAGLLPEHFYYWNDDVVYTLQMASLGWRIECVPAARAWQDLGQPPVYLRTRNTLALIASTAPRRYLVRELVRTVYWLARDAIRPRPGAPALRPRLHGLVDFCRRRWGPPPAGAR